MLTARICIWREAPTWAVSASSSGSTAASTGWATSGAASSRAPASAALAARRRGGVGHRSAGRPRRLRGLDPAPDHGGDAARPLGRLRADHPAPARHGAGADPRRAAPTPRSGWSTPSCWQPMAGSQPQTLRGRARPAWIVLQVLLRDPAAVLAEPPRATDAPPTASTPAPARPPTWTGAAATERRAVGGGRFGLDLAAVRPQQGAPCPTRPRPNSWRCAIPSTTSMRRWFTCWPNASS